MNIVKTSQYFISENMQYLLMFLIKTKMIGNIDKQNLLPKIPGFTQVYK